MPGDKYRSIKLPKIYEALRSKRGMSKQQAAAISNAMASKDVSASPPAAGYAHGPGGLLSAPGLGGRRAARLAKRVRLKAWSDAAREAAAAKRHQNALARHAGETTSGSDRRSVTGARSEARSTQAAGDRAARAIRAAGGVNKPAPKGSGGKKGGSTPASRQAEQIAREQRAEQRYQAHHAQQLAEREAERKRKLDEAAKKPKKGGGGGKGKKPPAPKQLTPEQIAAQQARDARQAKLDARRDRLDAIREQDRQARAARQSRLDTERETRRQQLDADRQARNERLARHEAEREADRAARAAKPAKAGREAPVARPRSYVVRKAMDTSEKAGSPGDYLVVEDPKQSSKWHLQVRTNGKPDHRLMGAAWAALHGGYRGNTYQGPDKDKAISKLRALYHSEKMSIPGEKDAGGFTVFKDAGGQWRWLSVSSSAYRDRDGEIVSTKALENAVAIADATGQRGPLRWWHCGTPFGSGIDLGDCDFQAVHGRFLIESGTFKSEQIALAFKDTTDEVSIGFAHPPDAPDTDKVFADVPIVIFERSLAPFGRVSNLFTDFLTTKEGTMDDAKLAALKERVGDDLLTTLLSGVETKDKAAQEAKIAYKADGSLDVDSLVSAIRADPSILEAALKAMDEGDSDTITEDALPPDDTGGMDEPDGDENMLTDAEIGQIAQMTAQMVVEQLMPHLGLGGKLDDLKTAIGGISGAYAKKDAEQAELRTQIQAMQAKLKELNGDMSASDKRAFKASTASETVINAETHPLAQQQPAADPIGSFLSGFVMNGGQQPPAAQ